MPSGTVCAYNDILGNGLIKLDEDSGIVKVSYRSIIDKQGGYKILNEGQRVEFEIIRTKKGLNAINIIRV
jgi:cold shock CspA family protein